MNMTEEMKMQEMSSTDSLDIRESKAHKRDAAVNTKELEEITDLSCMTCGTN